MSSIKDRYSFVIFDWDGTLMDSTGRIVSAMRASAEIVGLQVPDESAVKGIIGLSMQAVMDNLFNDVDQSLHSHFLEVYRHQYVEADKTPSPLFESAFSQLEWLRNLNIPIAVATGKARMGLNRVMQEVALSDYFDFTICADEALSKPDPEMVFQLMRKAKKRADETLVIGDSIHDINMANNAKVDAIAVTSGASDYKQLKDSNPIAILEHVGQLKHWAEE